jgi:hypothetical protein
MKSRKKKESVKQWSDADRKEACNRIKRIHLEAIKKYYVLD